MEAMRAFELEIAGIIFPAISLILNLLYTPLLVLPNSYLHVNREVESSDIASCSNEIHN